MKLKNKAQIQTWLEQGDTDKAIAELKRQFKAAKTGKTLLPEVLNLAGRLEKIIADKIDGSISYEQETLMLNRLRKDLLLFIEQVENQEIVQESSPIFIPAKQEKAEKRSGGFAWWWLLLPLAGVGIWWLFFQNEGNLVGNSVDSKIKLCTLTQMASGHCCTDDLQRISLYEMSDIIYVSAVFEGLSDKDPIVSGMLFWETGEPYPAKPIQLTLDQTIGDICYSAMIEPVHGIKWSLAKYTLKLQVNGKPAGEKTFELIR